MQKKKKKHISGLILAFASPQWYLIHMEMLNELTNVIQIFKRQLHMDFGHSFAIHMVDICASHLFTSPKMVELMELVEVEPNHPMKMQFTKGQTKK